MRNRPTRRLVLPLLVAAAFVPACSGPAPPPRPEGAGASPGGAAEARYVGPRPCATCHARIAGGFARTGMGRAFYRVGRILAPRGEGSPVRPRVPDSVTIERQSLRYDVLEVDGRVYQRQYRVDARGREVNLDTREVVYVLGSGNHSQ